MEEEVKEEKKKKKKKRRYKRKRGPKKKRGPKPKKKKEVKKSDFNIRDKHKYQLILINQGKRLKTLYSTPSERLVYTKFNGMLNDAKNVLFPIRYNNHEHYMKDASYELMIIKRKEDFDPETTMVQDDFGRYVEYETNNDEWIIYDRHRYDIEETFWVYGFHPRLQRKGFRWIYDNFIGKDDDKYKFKSIQIYKNKFIVECNGEVEMVICKTVDDAIRMYNLVEEMTIKDKFKNIAYMGNISKMSLSTRRNWIQRIMELTGWNQKKVTRSSTRD